MAGSSGTVQITPKGNEKAAPAPNVQAHWACQTLTSAGQPLQQQLTVGEKFWVKCEGPTAVLNCNQLKIELPQEQQYSLRVLASSGCDANRVEFVMTSYTAGGKTEFKTLYLSDGVGRVQLEGIGFEVKSVITPENNPKGEPYGPWGPFFISYPLWLSVAAVLFFGLLASVGFMIWRRRAARMALIRELKNHGSAQTPYNQFAKELRQLVRGLPVSIQTKELSPEESKAFARKLDADLRWFIARKYVVPAHVWPSRKILKYVQKSAKKTSQLALKSALQELSEATRTAKRLTPADAQQIIEICRKAADQIEELTSTSQGAL